MSSTECSARIPKKNTKTQLQTGVVFMRGMMKRSDKNSLTEMSISFNLIMFLNIPEEQKNCTLSIS